jgi:membrane-associated phospholipid phosphatase
MCQAASGARFEVALRRLAAFAVLWFVSSTLGQAAAQTNPLTPTTAAPLTSTAATQLVRPEFRWKVDAPLTATGAAAWLAAAGIDADVQAVPPQGLDPRGIDLQIDRDVVGNNDKTSDTASNWFRNASVAYPLALALGMAPEGARTRALVDRSLLYGQALLVSGGICTLIKVTVSRPRPFTYLPESERPSDSKYAVDATRAFLSMPSGHSCTAWCSAGFAITDHLISRPTAGWVERSAVGFMGGLLATSTSALRVEAGQHFPTDVVAGGAIGAAGGVAVPLLHRWFRGHERAPLPPARAWLQTAASTVVGVGAGLLISKGIAD